MQEKRALVFFVISCAFLLVAVLLCACAVLDIVFTLDRIANDPTVGEIDYVGVAWGHALAVLLTSVIGLIVTFIAKHFQTNDLIRFILLFVIFLFIVLIALSLFLFYI